MFCLRRGYGKEYEVESMSPIICNLVTYFSNTLREEKERNNLKTGIGVSRVHAHARVYSGVAA